METRFLGTTGLRVSELCFGAMTFGDTSFWKSIGGLDQGAADQLVATAFEHGINFYDTADIYSCGLSEQILGKALSSRRKEAIIATKLHFPMSRGANDKGQSRYHIIEACEASLKRLGTDYIDLYQVHSFDPKTALEETLDALTNLVRQGKIRYFGCSNYSAWQLMKALSISEKHHLNRYSSIQAFYSLLARDVEDEIIPLCLDQHVGFLVWSPLGWGFLTGKNRRGHGPKAGTRQATKSGAFIPFDIEKGYTIVDALDQVANECHVSIPQAAINFVLNKPVVTSVIIGARTVEQLKDNINATNWKLSPHQISALEAATGYEPKYPIWHQKLSEDER